MQDKKNGKVVQMRKRPSSSNNRAASRNNNTSKDRKKNAGKSSSVASTKAHKKNVASNRSTSFVAGLFFLVVLGYLVHNLYSFLTAPYIPVEMIQMGNIGTPTIVEGIIIRDETVYTAPRAGEIRYNVRENDRVRPRTVVASIQNPNVVDSINDSLNEVGNEAQRINDLRGELSDPAIRDIDRQIRNMIDSRLSRHIRPNMAEVYTLRDNIAQNISIRNQIIMNENRDVIAEIDRELQILQNQLNSSMEEIRIIHGGIMTPIIDGLENYLTFGNMRQLTREETRQNVNRNPIASRRDFQEGDNVFKIVHSNTWYIAAYIPNNLMEDFRGRIYIEGRIAPLEVSIFHREVGYTETFVLLRSTRFMIDYLDTRSVFFSFVDSNPQGLRISNTAIESRTYLLIPIEFVHGETPYVQPFVQRVFGADYETIPLSVGLERDYYVYAVAADSFSLRLGDTLIHNYDSSIVHNITEERILQGVYRITTGFAAFTPIYIPEGTPADAFYTVLDPTLNPGIRANNHIVTDASMAYDGKIIFSRVR